MTTGIRHLLVMAICVSLPFSFMSCKRERAVKISFSRPTARPEITFSPEKDDSIWRYGVLIYPAEGAREKYEHVEWDFNGPGPDNTWFTADDQIDSYSATSHDRSGNMNSDIVFTGPGPDAQWLTDDDVISFYTTFETLRDRRRETHYKGPGPDGVWFTKDDEKDWDALFTYDSGGRKVSNESCDFGEDKISFTKGDPCRYYHGFQYDDKGNLLREIQFNGSGPDHVRFTDDDEVGMYEEFIYDTDNRLHQKRTCSGPGTDGSWFAGDDQCTSYRSYVYGPDGSWRREIAYIGSGIDRIMGTEDDPIFRYKVDLYDEHGNWIRSVSYDSPGEDLLWFTSDDSISPLIDSVKYSEFTYDGQDRLTMRIHYNGPGPDGRFFK